MTAAPNGSKHRQAGMHGRSSSPRAERGVGVSDWGELLPLSLAHCVRYTSSCRRAQRRVDGEKRGRYFPISRPWWSRERGEVGGGLGRLVGSTVCLVCLAEERREMGERKVRGLMDAMVFKI